MIQEQDVNYQNSHWARRRRVIWFWKWQGRKWPPAFSCHRQQFAATCSTRVAASGRQRSLVTGSNLQPRAATRVAASGRKWPPDILPRKRFHIFRGHLQPLQWPPVSASILFSAAATCSQSSGRQRPPAFGFSSAATCSHSSGRQWPPAYSFHRQPLAATCSQSSGRKWPPEQVAASVSGRQSKWPQVTASGRLCQNQIRALLHALWKFPPSWNFKLTWSVHKVTWYQNSHPIKLGNDTCRPQEQDVVKMSTPMELQIDLERLQG